MRASLVVLIALAIGSSTACRRQCGEGAEPRESTWIESIPRGATIRERASVAIFARRGADLRLVERLTGRLPLGSTPVELEGFRALLETGGGDGGWLDRERPAVVYHSRRWSAVLPIDGGGVAGLRDALRGRTGWTVRRASDSLWVSAPDAVGGRRLTLSLAGDAYVQVVAGRGTGEASSEGAGAPDRTDRKAVNRKRLLEPLIEAERGIVGVVDVDAWLGRLGTSGRARKLVRRVVDQLGTVGLHLRLDGKGRADSKARALVGTLRLAEPAGVTRAVGPIGSPDRALPEGLNRLFDGTEFAVARVSVAPVELYRLVRSGLSPAGRRAMAAYWKRAARRLSLEHPREMLSKWSGHALVVLSGIDRERLQAGWAGVDELLSLDATRETVVFPIEQRERWERALDAVTQLSRGRLSRSSGDRLAEYAWLADGRLAWTLLLGNEYLVYADSAEGLERGRRLLEGTDSDGQSSPPASERSYGVLLRGRSRSGIYVDGVQLGRALSDQSGGRSGWWGGAVRSATVVARPAGGVERVRVRLRLSDRAKRP
ncbi:MAG: hypothetical protein ABEL76_09620 [Bradymonadaceae bacterium]